jgi:hypothetical protein
MLLPQAFHLNGVFLPSASNFSPTVDLTKGAFVYLPAYPVGRSYHRKFNFSGIHPSFLSHIGSNLEDSAYKKLHNSFFFS